MNKNKTGEECFRDQKFKDALRKWEVNADGKLTYLLDKAGYKDIEKYEDITTDSDQENVKRIACKGRDYYIVVTIMEIYDAKAPVYFWVEYREEGRKIKNKYVLKSRDNIYRKMEVIHDMRAVKFDDLDEIVEIDYYGRMVEYAKTYSDDETGKVGVNMWIKMKDFPDGYANLELERKFAEMKQSEVRSFKQCVVEDDTLTPFTSYEIRLAKVDPIGIVTEIYREHLVEGNFIEAEFTDNLK